MDKTVIGPDVGSDIDLFDEVDGVAGLPHSQAVAVDGADGRRVYVSGTGPIDGDGAVVAPGDVAAQTETILETIAAILDRVGGEFDDVVRLTVYTDELTEAEYLDVCRVRERFLTRDHYPASTMVKTADVGIEGMRVEMDADAVVPRDGWDVRTLDAE